MADDRLLAPSQAAELTPAVLAIDGGNSKTDVALVADDGTLLASARGPGINAHDVGVDPTVLILDAVVKQAAAQLSGRYRTDGTGWVAMHTVACLANADLPEEEAEHAAAVQAQGWSPTATVVNDTCGQVWPIEPKGRRRTGAWPWCAARASTPSAWHPTAG